MNKNQIAAALQEGGYLDHNNAFLEGYLGAKPKSLFGMFKDVGYSISRQIVLSYADGALCIVKFKKKQIVSVAKFKLEDVIAYSTQEDGPSKIMNIYASVERKKNDYYFKTMQDIGARDRLIVAGRK